MWKPIILDVECIVCNKSLQKINHIPQDNKMGKILKINHNRRLRTPNWSLEEKQHLLELIKQRKEVVVVKSNNGPNHYEEKDIAWNEILRELCAKFGSKFSGSSIKKVKTQWQNMKRIAREEIAAHGEMLEKYSRISLDVCNILELVKDGVLKKDESENSNECTITTNIEIKTESIDEEMNEPSCSGINNQCSEPDITQNDTNVINDLESSEQSSASEQANDNDLTYESHTFATPTRSHQTKPTEIELAIEPDVLENNNINAVHSKMQEFLKFSAEEKKIRMESLREERQVMRAMRETAELNKIIAEQRLKHVLWIKRQDIAMYTGEPGSGAGMGGGGGGTIREAGGAFGRMEAARENEYFYKKQKEQLKNLRAHLSKEIDFHEQQIKRHEDAIRRHKDQMTDLHHHK